MFSGITRQLSPSRIGLSGFVACLLTAAPAAAQPQEEVLYYHADAIGSVRAITDASGNVVQRYDYLAFGETWSADGSVDNSRQFAGADRDATNGLDNLEARDYASGNGRFTTPDDPSYMDALVPQSMNRYAYAYNNPLRWVDPSGHEGECVESNTNACVSRDIHYITLDPSTAQWLLDRWNSVAETVQRVGQVASNLQPPNSRCVAASVIGGTVAGTVRGGALALVTGPGGAVTIPAGAATGAALGLGVGMVACMAASNAGGGAGGEFKKAKPNVSGKEGAKDAPSWAKAHRPLVGESGKDFAKRLLDGKYGPGKWNRGPGSEFNQIQKWADRSFE